MRRLPWSLVTATALLFSLSTGSLADATPTLSFFSGGDSANAHWLATMDQPPGDTDNQAIELQTTNDAPTFSKGYAGILFHHVEGIPASVFPDSDFWVRTPMFAGNSLGSPRLVVAFQTTAGVADGDAELTPNVLTSQWQHVSDMTDYPNSGWDIHSAACPFMYHQKWTVAQSCHTGDVVRTVFIVADAYGIDHLLDDITVDNKQFSSASDNSNGNNNPAGPSATTDPTLIPPLDLVLPQPTS